MFSCARPAVVFDCAAGLRVVSGCAAGARLGGTAIQRVSPVMKAALGPGMIALRAVVQHDLFGEPQTEIIFEKMRLAEMVFQLDHSRAGPDRTESVRVLPYHCEIHALPTRNFHWRRSERPDRRRSFVRASLQPQPGYVVHGSRRRSLHGLLSLRLRSVD